MPDLEHLVRPHNVELKHATGCFHQGRVQLCRIAALTEVIGLQIVQVHGTGTHHQGTIATIKAVTADRGDASSFIACYVLLE